MMPFDNEPSAQEEIKALFFIDMHEEPHLFFAA